MKLPRMNQTERLVFTSTFSACLENMTSKVDNSNAEVALHHALHTMFSFRQALRDAKDE